MNTVVSWIVLEKGEPSLEYNGISGVSTSRAVAE